MRRTLGSLQVEKGMTTMVAVDKHLGAEMCSELKVDGGRFHLHALRKSNATSQALHVLPVCIDIIVL